MYSTIRHVDEKIVCSQCWCHAQCRDQVLVHESSLHVLVWPMWHQICVSALSPSVKWPERKDKLSSQWLRRSEFVPDVSKESGIAVAPGSQRCASNSPHLRMCESVLSMSCWASWSRDSDIWDWDNKSDSLSESDSKYSDCAARTILSARVSSKNDSRCTSKWSLSPI